MFPVLQMAGQRHRNIGSPPAMVVYNLVNSVSYNTSYFRRKVDSAVDAYRAVVHKSHDSWPPCVPINDGDFAVGGGVGILPSQLSTPILRVPSTRSPPCSAAVVALSTRELARVGAGYGGGSACTYVHLQGSAEAGAPGRQAGLALLADQSQALVTLQLAATDATLVAASCPVRVPLENTGSVALTSLRTNWNCGFELFGASARVEGISPEAGGGAELRLGPGALASRGLFHRASLSELLLPERAVMNLSQLLALGAHVALLAGLPAAPPQQLAPQPFVSIYVSPLFAQEKRDDATIDSTFTCPG